MAKIIKFKANSGKIVGKKSTKRPNQFSFGKGFLFLLLFPIYNLVFIYNLLFKLPAKRSHILGLIRLSFWGYLFWVPNHENLFRTVFAGYSESVQTSYVFFTVTTFVMAVISFFVFLGFHKNISIPFEDENLPGVPGMQDTMFTMRQINWRLSNQTERNKFIDRMFKD